MPVIQTNNNGKPVVANSVFDGNSAVDLGGGVAKVGGSPVPVNRILSGDGAGHPPRTFGCPVN